MAALASTIVILHYMWKLRHIESKHFLSTQPTCGGQLVPGSVFFTTVFKYNFVLSKQSNAFALKQSFMWAQSYSEEKGINELFP